MTIVVAYLHERTTYIRLIQIVSGENNYFQKCFSLFFSFFVQFLFLFFFQFFPIFFFNFPIFFFSHLLAFTVSFLNLSGCIINHNKNLLFCEGKMLNGMKFNSNKVVGGIEFNNDYSFARINRFIETEVKPIVKNGKSGFEYHHNTLIGYVADTVYFLDSYGEHQLLNSPALSVRSESTISMTHHHMVWQLITHHHNIYLMMKQLK